MKALKTEKPILTGMQDPLIGTVLDGRYKILALVGEGATGIVYKAEHQLMDRPVAVKILRSLLLSDPKAVKQFQQEAKAISVLSHPNIVTVHDFGESNDKTPYLVMDFLEGMSLKEALDGGTPLPQRRVADIFLQASSALAYAHKQGIIHRDLKPRNIMLSKMDGGGEHAKLVDFGMAKFLPEAGKEGQQLTQSGNLAGDPRYMSPEQFLGRELDPRSDVYSLGCLMYEALTGRPPFYDDLPLNIMQLHLTSMPPSFQKMRPDTSVSPRLEGLVLKALQKKPGDRYQSAAEMHDALKLISGEIEGSSNVSVSRLSLLRHYSGLIKLALILLFFLAASIGMTWLASTRTGNIECCKAWLTIQKATGQTHDQMAPTMMRLADLYEENGDWLNLRSTLEELFKLTKEQFGEFSIEVIDVFIRLANTSIKLNDKEGAIAFAQSAAATEEQSITKIKDRVRLLNTTQSMRQLTESLELALGKKNLEMLQPYRNLGQIYLLLDRHEEAERTFQRALQTCDSEQSLVTSPACVEVLGDLACAQESIGATEAASRSLARILKVSRLHPAQAAVYFENYSVVCANKQKYEESIKWRLEAAKLRQGPENDAAYFQDLLAVAEYYRKLTLDEKAMPYYLQAIEGLKKYKYSNPSIYSDAISRLAYMYEEQGKHEAAEPLYNELETMNSNRNR